LLPKLPSDRSVPPLIARDLKSPEIEILFRQLPSLAAVVSMPETAMHEDNDLRRREHDVGRPGQILGMSPVTKRR
jgi:hypothetical protein